MQNQNISFIRVASARVFPGVTLALFLLGCLLLLAGCGSGSGSSSQEPTGTLTLDLAETVTRKGELAVRGTVEPDQRVFLLDGGGRLIGEAAVEQGHWSYLLVGLAPGKNSFTVQATNGSGTTARLNAILVRDVKVPEFSIDPFPPVTAADQLSLTWSVPVGVLVTVKTDPASASGALLLSDGPLGCTLTHLPEGGTGLQLIASDSAGNSAKTDLWIRRDSRPPVLTLKLPTTSHRKSLTLVGTAEPGALVHVATDMRGSDGYAFSSGGRWKFTVDPLGPGTSRFTVTARDAAGNVATVVGETTLKAAEVIAHGGSSFAAPGNTLAAINLAWEQGADLVEVDLQLSADNRIMLLHDASTWSTAGTDLVVRGNHSALLRTLDVGSYKGSQYAGERIPFLEEALATLPPNRRMLLEIKTGEEILPYLQQVISASGKRERIMVYATNPPLFSMLGRLRQLMPDLTIGYSVTGVTDERQLIQAALETKVNFLSVHQDCVTPSLIAAASQEGLQIFAWTVNNPDIAKMLIWYGIDGYLTDFPDFMRKQVF